MPYSITWAQGIVGDWWMLCTRAQHFLTHYENTIRQMGRESWLQPGESLLKDLEITVAYSKTQRPAREAWQTIKACNKKHGSTLKSMEKRLIPAYVTIRLCALRYKSTKYVELRQLDLFC